MTRPRFGALYVILLPVLVLPVVVMLWLLVRGDIARQFYHQAMAASAGGDPALAREYFRIAASHGHPDAAYNLAMMHLLGVGGPVDADAAREQFELAALYGSIDAEYQLGLLDESRQPDPDYNGAALHYNRAALGGHAAAQAMIARLYETGVGVGRSVILAAEFYRKAASAGHTPSQCALAELYLSAPELHDDQEAFRLFSLAAAAGLPRAHTGLGCLYERGWEGHAPDRDKAAACYQTAAEHGEPDAMVNLGDLVASEDPARARRLYERAANLDCAPAWHRLGMLHFNGVGEKANYPEALLCFERAAAGGNAASWINLGIMYEQGRGTPVDPGRAEQCYRQALVMGHPEAGKRLAALGK